MLLNKRTENITSLTRKKNEILIRLLHILSITLWHLTYSTLLFCAVCYIVQ